jgi:hypothetical protein
VIGGTHFLASAFVGAGLYVQVGDVSLAGLPAQWDYLTADAAGKRRLAQRRGRITDTATNQVVGASPTRPVCMARHRRF